MDLIDRQAAIDAIRNIKAITGTHDDEILLIDKAQAQTELMMLPSAQPERLTDDDFETIRIHLNAQKEKLCNQQRWEEAEEYQRIIDRFMAFASAESQIIHCKDCKHRDTEECPMYYEEWVSFEEDGYIESDNIEHDQTRDDGFCDRGEVEDE